MHLAARLLQQHRVALRGRQRAALHEHLTVQSFALRDLEQRRVERCRVDEPELVGERSEIHDGRRGVRRVDATSPEIDSPLATIGCVHLEAAAEPPIARVHEQVHERA